MGLVLARSLLELLYCVLCVEGRDPFTCSVPTHMTSWILVENGAFENVELSIESHISNDIFIIF